MRVLFKSCNLIGDSLCISPALREWCFGHVGQLEEVYMQTLPDHVAPLYAGMVRDLPIKEFKTVFERPEGTFDFEANFDVNKAFQICDQKKCHISEAYAEMIGVELVGHPRWKLKEVYIPTDTDLFLQDPTVASLCRKNPVLISMFSASCTSRDKDHPGLLPNKMLPFSKWKPLMSLLRKAMPNNPIRFLGAPSDVVPDEIQHSSEEVMFGIPLNKVALIMQHASIVVTLDNGMGHLAASQEAPMFLMYPRCLGLHYILPIGNSNLTYVHIDPAYVSPAQLRWELEKALKKFNLTTETV